MGGIGHNYEVVGVASRSPQQVRMNKLRQRLVSLGIARQIDLLTNDINPVSGTGQVLIQLDDIALKAWVSEEPEAAKATKVFGYPVITSTDAVIASDENAA